MCTHICLTRSLKKPLSRTINVNCENCYICIHSYRTKHSYTNVTCMCIYICLSRSLKNPVSTHIYKLALTDCAVNVNSETKALTCAKFSAYVEFSAYIYFYKSLMTFAERKAMVLAYGYGLSIELIKTYIIKLICKYTLI